MVNIEREAGPEKVEERLALTLALKGSMQLNSENEIKVGTSARRVDKAIKDRKVS